MKPNMIGAYGPWAADIVGDEPPALSLRTGKWTDVEEWRRIAQARVLELLAQPDTGGPPQPTVHRQFTYDGLHVEELSWQLPYGPATRAVFLKPERATGKLPGILALHDHGGLKYFGKRKIIVHGTGDGAGRRDYAGRVRASRRRGSLPMQLLPRPSQARQANAGRGIRVVRSMAGSVMTADRPRSHPHSGIAKLRLKPSRTPFGLVSIRSRGERLGRRDLRLPTAPVEWPSRDFGMAVPRPSVVGQLGPGT